MKWGCTYKAQQPTKMYPHTPFPPLIHSCTPTCAHTSLGVCRQVGVSAPRKGVWEGRQALLPSAMGLQHSTGSHHCHAPLACTLASEINWKSHRMFLRNYANRLQIFRELLLQHCQMGPLLISAFWCGVVKSPRSPVRELSSTVQACLLLYLVLHFFQMEPEPLPPAPQLTANRSQ